MHYWALSLTNLSGKASYTWPSFQMVFKLYIRFEDPFISTCALDENGVLQREACDLNTWQKCKSTPKTNKGVQEAWMRLLLNSELKRPGYQPQASGKAQAVGTSRFFEVPSHCLCVSGYGDQKDISAKKRGPRSFKRGATLFPDKVQILIHYHKSYLQLLQQGL